MPQKFKNNPKVKSNKNAQSTQVHAQVSEAVVLHLQGRLQEAQEIYEDILRKDSKNFDALHLLGVIAYQLGRNQHAVTLYQQAIKIIQNNAEVYSNLGNALAGLKQYEAALNSYDKAIKIKPNFAQVHNNRGNALLELKQLQAAIASYENAIKIKPDYAEAYFSKGNALLELQQIMLAILSFEQAIDLNPTFAEAYNNRGAAQFKLGQIQAAISSYDQAIKINSSYAEAYSNRGHLLLKEKRIDAALINFEMAIKIKADYYQAYNSHGTALKLLSRYVDSCQSIKTALSFNPKSPSAQQSQSSVLSSMSDYREVCKYSDAALSLATDSMRAEVWGNRLYNWIYHPDLSAQEICAEHIRWGNQFAALGQEGFAVHDRTPVRRLRVGYVSPDFRGHTCRFYFEPLFSQHDHTNFEVFAYASVFHEDEHTQRFKPYFDHWRDIHSLTDEAAAQMIRQDKIDILVDGCGHMIDTRLTVFTHKPAPIQVTWLGSAWTTGLAQMDYVLFDPYMAPEGTAASEQIVRLPRTWAAFRPGERATQSPVKTSPAVTNGYVTFGYSGRSERLNHRVFKSWGRILAKLPQARLVLDYKAFVDPKTQVYYKEFLQAHGVDTSRVLMRDSDNIFEGLGDIDILLDSFPHSGGTMLFDAIWMGVPALTVASPRPVGRIGTSLMTNLGLPEWVAKDEQEYEDKAVAYAQDIPALASLRSGMRARMEASPVMNEKAFAQDVEAAFETMWRTWVDSSNQELLSVRNH